MGSEVRRRKLRKIDVSIESSIIVNFRITKELRIWLLSEFDEMDSYGVILITIGIIVLILCGLQLYTIKFKLSREKNTQLMLLSSLCWADFIQGTVFVGIMASKEVGSISALLASKEVGLISALFLWEQ